MTEITEDRDFKTNDEEGLESLGRPANEYVKKDLEKIITVRYH